MNAKEKPSHEEVCEPPLPPNHPIFKKLSKINGTVNNMTIDQLRQQLNQLNLEVRSELKIIVYHLSLILCFIYETNQWFNRFVQKETQKPL